MKKSIVIALAGAALVPAFAFAQQQASTTFRVTANVQAVCEVRASDLNFGSYSAQAASRLDGTTVVTVMCTPQTSYNVGLNEGTSPGATVNQRKMVSGANALDYQLYRDTNRSQIWGNTTGTDTLTGVGTGIDQEHTVFGAIPAQQSIPAGSYGDTITVRVYF